MKVHGLGRRAFSTGAAVAPSGGEGPKNLPWVPRATTETQFVLERRRYRAAVHHARKNFAEEIRHAKDAKMALEAKVRASAAIRRAERLKRRKELQDIRAKEIAEEMERIREAREKKRAADLEHYQARERLERAKSMFAVETLEEEKSSWITSADDLTPERLLTLNTPPGFHRPRFQILYGHWPLPWEYSIDVSQLPKDAPVIRLDPDEKKKPLPTARQPVDGLQDLSLEDSLEVSMKAHLAEHERLAEKGLVQARSRVKLVPIEEKDENMYDMAADYDDYVAFEPENPFVSAEKRSPAK